MGFFFHDPTMDFSCSGYLRLATASSWLIFPVQRSHGCPGRQEASRASWAKRLARSESVIYHHFLIVPTVFMAIDLGYGGYDMVYNPFLDTSLSLIIMVSFQLSRKYGISRCAPIFDREVCDLLSWHGQQFPWDFPWNFARSWPFPPSSLGKWG